MTAHCIRKGGHDVPIRQTFTDGIHRLSHAKHTAFQVREGALFLRIGASREDEIGLPPCLSEKRILDDQQLKPLQRRPYFHRGRKRRERILSNDVQGFNLAALAAFEDVHEMSTRARGRKRAFPNLAESLACEGSSKDACPGRNSGCDTHVDGALFIRLFGQGVHAATR